MDNVTATAALRDIALRACEEHSVTVTRDGKEYTYRCRVSDVSDVRFNLLVVVNAVCTKKVALELLTKTRKAIREAANSAGVKWRYPRQRAAKGGKTWAHSTGFWHMGNHCVTDFYAVFVGGEKGRSI